MFRTVSIGGGPSKALQALEAAGLENDIRSIRYSPNGALVVGEVNKAQNALWRYELESGKLENFRSLPWTDSMVRFSASGVMTFLSTRNAAKELWTASPDGRNARVIHTSGPEILYQVPSPDGKSVAVLVGAGELYTIPIAGGGAKRLLANRTVFPVSWSKDGRSLYVGATAKTPKEDRVLKLPSNGGEPVEFVKQDSFGARESPDGKYLYFTNSRYPKLWRMPLFGGAAEAVSDQYLHFWSDFAVTAKAIYYIARGASDSDLTLLRVDSLTRKSAKAVQLNFHPTVLEPSPDGRYLYLERHDAPRGGLFKIDGL